MWSSSGSYPGLLPTGHCGSVGVRGGDRLFPPAWRHGSRGVESGCRFERRRSRCLLQLRPAGEVGRRVVVPVDGEPTGLAVVGALGEIRRSFTWPQPEQVFDDANHLSATTSSRPYQSALLTSWRAASPTSRDQRRNCDHILVHGPNSAGRSRHWYSLCAAEWIQLTTVRRSGPKRGPHLSGQTSGGTGICRCSSRRSLGYGTPARSVSGDLVPRGTRTRPARSKYSSRQPAVVPLEHRSKVCQLLAGIEPRRAKRGGPQLLRGSTE